MASTSKLFFIGIISAIAAGCSQAGSSPAVKSAGSETSLAKIAMPKPPAQDPSKGFGLEGSTNTTTATPAPIPEKALAAQGGGYWFTPSSSEVNVPAGYKQYYNAQGVASNWYGIPGTGADAKTFTMVKGNESQVDMNQQFIAKQSTTGWNSGTIVNAQGQPYSITSGSNAIVSNGYTVGPNNQFVYNWNAQPVGTNSVLKSQTVVPFSTNGYDITAGLTNAAGMTYMNAQGQPVVYQPQGAAASVGVMTGQGQQAALFAGFFSKLFGQ